MTRCLLLSALALFAVGCTDDRPATPPDGGEDTGGGTPDLGPAPDGPAFDPDKWHTFAAGPFDVPAGQERFFCFTQTLQEDLYANEISVGGKAVVHHMLLSRTQSPDPDGFFECDVLFQANWLPLFVAGTGSANLVLPEGAGHILPKGTQLTMQLHLLNASTEPVTETVEVGLRRMKTLPEKPASVVVFGSTNIALPARQDSSVVGTCPSNSDMTLFSVFPHMHYLGRSMVVESGRDEASMKEVFRRDDYDFDYQYLEPLDLTISAGDMVRVSCNYSNELDELVTFGESTTNEMCFFIGFATGAEGTLPGCISAEGGAGSLIPEECGIDPPNDIGLGAQCSAGGGECATGLSCTEDIEQIAGPEVCIGIGCTQQSDCGEGGVCCNIPAASVAVCLPPSCVLSICDILE